MWTSSAQRIKKYGLELNSWNVKILTLFELFADPLVVEVEASSRIRFAGGERCSQELSVALDIYTHWK